MIAIQLVQGFVGTIKYILNFEGQIVDLEHRTVTFNFTDRLEQNRYSILCKKGTSPGEVLIQFSAKETEGFGDFYGEFVVKSIRDTSIYPITGHVLLKIRKRI